MLQALREALRQCRCACVRACVCVCMSFEGEGGGTGWEFDPPEPIPGPSRRGRRGSPALLPHVEVETLVKQRRTLVRRQLDPRQTQPEGPCTPRQLLDDEDR